MAHDEYHRPFGRTVSALIIAFCLTAWAAPNPAAAAPLKCRRTVSKAGAVFVQAELKATQKCEDTILRGKFAGPCPDAKTTAKLTKLRAKLANVIGHACGGGDKTCGSGDESLPAIGWTTGTCPDIAQAGCTNTITSCVGVTDCVRCVDENAVGGTIDLAFDAFVLNTPDPAVRKCQRIIGKESAAFVAAQVRALQSCEDRVLRGKSAGPCPDLSAAAKLGKIQAKMQQKVCKACGGPSRVCGGNDDLTPTQIGFAATCPGVTIPGGASCGGAVGTLGQLVTCLDCVGRQRASCVDRLAAPGVATYPVECTQASSGQPTPTPTATPGGGGATSTPGGGGATSTPDGGGATSTPTGGVPTPTPTATATSVTVKIDLTSPLGLLATLVGLDVTYPTNIGGIAGSGTLASCNTSAGTLSVLDDDAGLLDLDLDLGILGLGFPIELTCTFDLLPGETLIAADIGVTVAQLHGLLGAILDPLLLGVTTEIVP